MNKLTAIGFNVACSGMTLGRAPHAVLSALGGVLIQTDVVDGHFRWQVLAIFHSVRQCALALRVGAVVADPAHGASAGVTRLGHAPAVRDGRVQDQIHRLVGYVRPCQLLQRRAWYAEYELVVQIPLQITVNSRLPFQTVHMMTFEMCRF